MHAFRPGASRSRAPSIRARLALLVLAVVLPLTATLAYLLVSDRSDDQQSALDSSLAVANLATANISRLLEDSRSQLAWIAERPLVRAVDPGRCDPIVRDFPGLHSEFTNLAVVDLSGRVVCSALPQPGGQLVSVADAPWFRTARATGQFTVSEPLVGPISGEWVSVLAQPIRGSDGRLVGLIALGIDLVRYQSAFGNAVLPRDGLITVVDAQGTVVARSLDPERWVGKDGRAAEIVRRALAQGEGTTVATGLDGTRRLYAYTRLPEAGWIVYAGIPTEVAFADANANALRGGLLALASVLLAGALAFYAGSSIQRSVRRLVAAVRAVGGGQLDVRAPVEGLTEIAEIAQSFNEMVDARSHAEEALRQSQEQLLQAQKMEAVGRLAGGVAHDFNNLLTAVSGYTDLLLSRIDDPAARRDLAEIAKASERAAALTRQLLAFSRKQLLRPRVVDLNEVVAETEELLRRLIGADVELETLLEPEPVPVEADPQQLQQVILNLAVNARDAMPDGGTLTIQTRRSDDSAYLAVRDTGCGMDADTRAHVFEPFFTTKAEGKGTGLGLATVYGIVEQSGGSISLESEPDRGTSFEIAFPRAQGRIEPVGRERSRGAAGGGSETVLLVEDYEVVEDLIRQVLEGRGYAVVSAKNGDEALELAKRHTEPIHLLLTDLIMPKMGGHELAERLASVHLETKVLYMSGYADADNPEHGTIAAGAAFIAKPFSTDALARKVRETLEAT